MTTWPVELPEAVCCGDVGEPAGTSDAGGGAKLPEREDEVLELLHRLDTAFRDSESIEATCSLAGHLAATQLLRWLEDQCASGEWYAATAMRVLSHLCWSERCQADLCTSECLGVVAGLYRGADAEMREKIAQLILAFLRDRVGRCCEAVLQSGMLKVMASLLVEEVPGNPVLRRELFAATVACAQQAVACSHAARPRVAKGCTAALRVLARRRAPAEEAVPLARIARLCQAAGGEEEAR